jgi:hypothetical protein
VSRLARLLALGLAALHLAVTLSPCLGSEPVLSVNLDRSAPATAPLAIQRACPCRCARGPAALLVAGTHVAPPPAALRLVLPKLRHGHREPAEAAPLPPLRTVDHVPLPV